MGNTEVLSVEDLLSGVSGRSDEHMLNAVDMLSSSIGKKRASEAQRRQRVKGDA